MIFRTFSYNLKELYMDITLVVMAAGMGSRFGGLKQAEPVTEDGKGILDFTCYDAQKAGFNKVVFIVREDMKEDFKSLIGNRIAKRIPVEYVIQDTSILPEGRKKPFGTGHAILCARNAVKGPFAIVNADDYYGSNAFKDLYRHLVNAKEGDYAMVAYELKNTVSENGTVSRGVCKVRDGYLEDVEEVLKIDKDGNCNYEGQDTKLPLDTPVSMNLWGFTSNLFDTLEKGMKEFLASADLMKDEYLIPRVVGDLIDRGEVKVKVYLTKDKWSGITYREDLPGLKEAIKGYIEQGLYEGL